MSRILGGRCFALLAPRSLRPLGHLRCASSLPPDVSVVSAPNLSANAPLQKTSHEATKGTEKSSYFRSQLSGFSASPPPCLGASVRAFPDSLKKNWSPRKCPTSRFRMPGEMITKFIQFLPQSRRGTEKDCPRINRIPANPWRAMLRQRPSLRRERASSWRGSTSSQRILWKANWLFGSFLTLASDFTAL